MKQMYLLWNLPMLLNKCGINPISEREVTNNQFFVFGMQRLCGCWNTFQCVKVDYHSNNEEYDYEVRLSDNFITDHQWGVRMIKHDLHHELSVRKKMISNEVPFQLCFYWELSNSSKCLTSILHCQRRQPERQRAMLLNHGDAWLSTKHCYCSRYCTTH